MFVKRTAVVLVILSLFSCKDGEDEGTLNLNTGEGTKTFVGTEECKAVALEGSESNPEEIFDGGSGIFKLESLRAFVVAKIKKSDNPEGRFNLSVVENGPSYDMNVDCRNYERDFDRTLYFKWGPLSELVRRSDGALGGATMEFEFGIGPEAKEDRLRVESVAPIFDFIRDDVKLRKVHSGRFQLVQTAETEDAESVLTIQSVATYQI